MILETKPTRQQLDDRTFWDDKPHGVIYDGYKYTPYYSILLNGEPIEFTTENGKKVGNSFPYDVAVSEVEHLSNEHDNITMKITGYSEMFVRADELKTA